MAERARLLELDGLRGIAIGIVLVFHYFTLSIHPSHGTLLAYVMASTRLAWSGVDLFFVLSGFLIGGILLDARESSNYFKVFYVRRFFRIVPIYICCLLAYFSLVAAVQRGHAPQFAYMTADQIPTGSYFLFLQNLWMAARNTFGVAGLGVSWSLAVEEQFYLTLPLIIRLVPKRYTRTVLFSGIVLAIVIRTVIHALWPEHLLACYVLMPCRADALFLGVLGALAIRDERFGQYVQRHRTTLRIALLLIGAGVLILMRFSWSNMGPAMIYGGYTWLATFYLSVLLYSLIFPDSRTSAVLRWKPLRGLGSIAYGAYLFHGLLLMIIYSIVRSHPPVILGFGDFVVSCSALAATLSLCWLSWTYFEKPAQLLGHRWRYKFDPEPASVQEDLIDDGELETAD